MGWIERVRALAGSSFFRFLVAGTLNTACTYLVYLACLSLVSYPWAYSVSFAAGIALGYRLNSGWVYKEKATLRTASRYPLLYAGNYVLGLALLALFVERLGIHKEIAPLLMVAISVPVMFLSTRMLFTGKRKK